MLTHADLFAGMGGMSLALRGVSVPQLYCESDPAARAFLAAEFEAGRLPAAPVVEDVRDVAALRAHAPVDVVCAGFPCVGFSSVGQKRGLSDERSGLFHAAVAAAVALDASHVFLENVPDILAHSADVVEICRAVRDAGFELVRWTVVSASDVGAPHLRRRWFCLCSRRVRPAIGLDGAVPLPGWTACPSPTSTADRDDGLLRMLGNSLVPQAARAALEYLVRDRPLAPCAGTPKHGTCLDGAMLEMRPPAFPGHAPTRIVLDPRHYSGAARSRRRTPEVRGPLLRTKWPTPRAGPPSHSHVLTARSSWDLCTAARFCSSVDGVPQPRTDGEHRVSTAFVTYLMRGDPPMTS